MKCTKCGGELALIMPWFRSSYMQCKKCGLVDSVLTARIRNKAMSEAFKGKKYTLHPGSIVSSEQGETLTLRDQFAMSAMQGILSNEAMITNVIEESAAWVSREAYLMADAMLAARGK